MTPEKYKKARQLLTKGDLSLEVQRRLQQKVDEYERQATPAGGATGLAAFEEAAPEVAEQGQRAALQEKKAKEKSQSRSEYRVAREKARDDATSLSFENVLKSITGDDYERQRALSYAGQSKASARDLSEPLPEEVPGYYPEEDELAKHRDLEQRFAGVKPDASLEGVSASGLKEFFRPPELVGKTPGAGDVAQSALLPFTAMGDLSAYVYDEPGLEDFRTEMLAQGYGRQMEAVGEDSPLFRAWQDMKYQQAYDAAESAGRSIIRREFIDDPSWKQSLAMGSKDVLVPAALGAEGAITAGLGSEAQALAASQLGDEQATEKLRMAKAHDPYLVGMGADLAASMLPASVGGKLFKATGPLQQGLRGTVAKDLAGSALRGSATGALEGGVYAGGQVGSDLLQGNDTMSSEEFMLNALLSGGMGGGLGMGGELLGRGAARLGRKLPDTQSEPMARATREALQGDFELSPIKGVKPSEKAQAFIDKAKSEGRDPVQAHARPLIDALVQEHSLQNKGFGRWVEEQKARYAESPEGQAGVTPESAIDWALEHKRELADLPSDKPYYGKFLDAAFEQPRRVSVDEASALQVESPSTMVFSGEEASRMGLSAEGDGDMVVIRPKRLTADKFMNLVEDVSKYANRDPEAKGLEKALLKDRDQFAGNEITEQIILETGVSPEDFPGLDGLSLAMKGIQRVGDQFRTRQDRAGLPAGNEVAPRGTTLKARRDRRDGALMKPVPITKYVADSPLPALERYVQRGVDEKGILSDEVKGILNLLAEEGGLSKDMVRQRALAAYERLKSGQNLSDVANVRVGGGGAGIYAPVLQRVWSWAAPRIAAVSEKFGSSADELDPPMELPEIPGLPPIRKRQPPNPLVGKAKALESRVLGRSINQVSELADYSPEAAFGMLLDFSKNTPKGFVDVLQSGDPRIRSTMVGVAEKMGKGEQMRSTLDKMEQLAGVDSKQAFKERSDAIKWLIDLRDDLGSRYGASNIDWKGTQEELDVLESGWKVARSELKMDKEARQKLGEADTETDRDFASVVDDVGLGSDQVKYLRDGMREEGSGLDKFAGTDEKYPVKIEIEADGGIHLLDGRHRLKAAERAGKETINAEIRRIDEDRNIAEVIRRPVRIKPKGEAQESTAEATEVTVAPGTPRKGPPKVEPQHRPPLEPFHEDARRRFMLDLLGLDAGFRSMPYAGPNLRQPRPSKMTVRGGRAALKQDVGNEDEQTFNELSPDEILALYIMGEVMAKQEEAAPSVKPRSYPDPR